MTTFGQLSVIGMCIRSLLPGISAWVLLNAMRFESSVLSPSFFQLVVTIRYTGSIALVFNSGITVRVCLPFVQDDAVRMGNAFILTMSVLIGIRTMPTRLALDRRSWNHSRSRREVC